jgi:hypothetical protein
VFDFKNLSVFIARVEYEMGPSDDIDALSTVPVRYLSEEEKELLNLYQHSFDDDKVDINLILQIVIKILSTSKDGIVFFCQEFYKILYLHIVHVFY